MPFDSEVISAVDGAQLAPQALRSAYARRLFWPRYPFPLCAAEVGAFLSHRAAWRRIVEQDLDFGFIFEDDASVCQDAVKQSLEHLLENRDQWEYALLPAEKMGEFAMLTPRPQGVSLKTPHSPPLRAIGQVVSRKAATRLLACSEPFDRPIDTFVQMTWLTKVPVMVLSPSGVRDVSAATGGTTIARKRLGAHQRIHHEFARPAYRLMIFARYRLSSLVTRSMAKRDRL